MPKTDISFLWTLPFVCDSQNVLFVVIIPHLRRGLLLPGLRFDHVDDFAGLEVNPLAGTGPIARRLIVPSSVLAPSSVLLVAMPGAPSSFLFRGRKTASSTQTAFSSSLAFT